MSAKDSVPQDGRLIRIVIADDERLFREALRVLLQSEPGFVVVGEAGDGVQALTVVGEVKPDVLLLDLAMPRLPGLDALRTLSQSEQGVHTILLTGTMRREFIIAALQLGAKGIVVKDAAPEVLFTAIRAVLAGRYWLGDEALSDLVMSLRGLPTLTGEAHKKRPFGLTGRELQIIGAVVAGYSNKEIAQRFSVSPDTVKHHLTSIYDKLGVSNRLELALFALHHHLV
jgi:two-component system, NarL family, nitrate/nitrite response regulator NarL